MTEVQTTANRATKQGGIRGASVRSISPALADASHRHARYVHDVERYYLSAFWHNPVDGYNEAVRHQLCDDLFLDPQHGAMFRYLLVCAEDNLTPNVGTFREIAKLECVPYPEKYGFPPPPEDWLYIEVVPTGLDLWASQIVEYRIRRERARGMFAQCCELLGELPGGEASTVSPVVKLPTQTSRRISKGWKVA